MRSVSYSAILGLPVVALLTMALGIGANTAIFSVIDTVLLRPARVKDIDRLAVVLETDRNTSTTREPASLPDFLDFQAAQPAWSRSPPSRATR